MWMQLSHLTVSRVDCVCVQRLMWKWKIRRDSSQLTARPFVLAKKKKKNASFNQYKFTFNLQIYNLFANHSVSHQFNTKARNKKKSMRKIWIKRKYNLNISHLDVHFGNMTLLTYIMMMLNNWYHGISFYLSTKKKKKTNAEKKQQ